MFLFPINRISVITDVCKCQHQRQFKMSIHYLNRKAHKVQTVYIQINSKVTKQLFLLTTSSLYQVNSYENIENHQLGAIDLTNCQILVSKIRRNVWGSAVRINILVRKG